MNEFVKINTQDNVIVVLKDFKKGTVVSIDGIKITLNEDIRSGHKIAITNIAQDQNVIKYGCPIGHATKSICVGDWVHTHNTKTNLTDIIDYTFSQVLTPNTYTNQNLTFKGFKRKNGSVGIRNTLYIVPTVGCVNGIADLIIKKFRETTPNIEPFDDILVLKHSYGCSQLGSDHEYTKTILGDAVTHPNAGATLVLGLGCENNTIAEFKDSLGEFDESRIMFLTTQEVGDEVTKGAEILKILHKNVQDDKREDVPLSELKIGLKCGGSDGLSGITANPLLGWFSDFLIAQGGTTILTEVPEMFGAEKILMERCVNDKIFDKTVSLINDFKSYFIRYDQPIYENPSPGNKAGGITTLEDKSLGCTQKSGTTAVVDVLKYGEKTKCKGLNLLNSPGNDLIAASALASSGCQLVLFTTGRGTPFGSYVPTVKISTNSTLYNTKPHWIDFNAGTLVEGAEKEDMLNNFVQYVLKVCSGELVNNEKNNFREIAILKDGVSL